jgi:hypothetical protein
VDDNTAQALSSSSFFLSFFYYSDRVFCVSSSVEVRIGQRVDLLGLYDDIAGISI